MDRQNIAVTLDSILQDVEVVPSNGTTFFSAVEKLVSSPQIQAVTYHVHRLFIINNFGVLEVDKTKGKAFFDVTLENNEGDIINMIDTTMSCELLVGQHRLNSSIRLVMCNSMYHRKTIRIFIDDNTVDRVYLSYAVTLLNSDLRKRVVETVSLVCDNIMYKDGVTIVSM